LTAPAQTSAEASPRRIGGWPLALRVTAVSAPPLLLGLWLAIPALHPPPFVVQGPAAAQQACVGRWCAEVVAVAGRPLACRADLIGLPEDCRLRGPGPRGLPSMALAGLTEPLQARAVALPSALSLLGLAPTEAVLLELRRGEELLFRRSLRGHAMAALYGSWMFHAIYWPIAGLLLWRWPRSGLAQRLWARLPWTERAR
jgi:hypothetical protein